MLCFCDLKKQLQRFHNLTNNNKNSIVKVLILTNYAMITSHFYLKTAIINYIFGCLNP